MFTFFTEADPVFGRISWTMGLVWLAALLASGYILTRAHVRNAARRRFWQRWAIGTLVVGGLGFVALVLNGIEAPFFNIRAWIYLFAVATLAYWGYAAYVYFTALPSAATAAQRTSRPTRPSQRGDAQPGRGAKVYTNKAQQTNGQTQPPAPREPRPAATTTRRDARRDRKRRSR